MRKLLIATFILLGLAGCTEAVVNDHYGVCTTDQQCPGTSLCLDGICVQQISLTCAELGCPSGTECVDDVCMEPKPATADCDPYQWMTNSQWYCNYTQGEPAPEPWICHLNTTDGTANDGSCNIQCAEGDFWLPTNEFTIDANGSPPSLKTDYYGREFTCTQYAYIPPESTCGITVQVPHSLSVFSPADSNNERMIWFDFVKTGPDSSECAPEVVRIEVLEMDKVFGFVPNPTMRVEISNSLVTVPLSQYGETTSLSPEWSKTYYQWDGVMSVDRRTAILFDCTGNCVPPSMPVDTVIHTKLLRYWWRKNPSAPVISGNAGAEHTVFFIP